MLCEEDTWQDLWVAQLFRQHMVISLPDPHSVWYILGVRAHSLALMELTPSDDDARVWQIHPRREAIRPYVPVTSIHEYRCHDYTLGLKFTKKGCRVDVRLQSVDGMHLSYY